MIQRKSLWVAALLLTLAGCAQKFTYERFSMIREGVDDKTDVQTILGKPLHDLDDTWFYEDIDRHIAAHVFFNEDGRVRAKEWMDTKAGTWEGRNPDAAAPPEGEVRERRTNTRTYDD